MPMTLYGQYCPIAVTLELLGGRWTLLIIRELLDGPAGFNDLHRGVPLMSRSLLSDRLRDLEAARLVTHAHRGDYGLTEAGHALGTVIKSVGAWGQEWLDTALALEDIDGGYLMWNIRRSIRWHSFMGPRAVARFEFLDWADDRRLHWLVIEQNATDLCYIDPGHEIDVWIETELRTMVEVWMGWRPLEEAQTAGEFLIDGPSPFTEDPLSWIGQSPLAGIAKRPSAERVGRIMDRMRA